MPDTKDDAKNTVSTVPTKEQRSVTLTMPTMPKFKRPTVTPVLTGGRLRSGLLAAAFILTAVLGGVAGGWLEANRINSLGFNGSAFSNEKKIVTNQSQLISQIAKTVGPSVVSVNVTLTTANAAPTGFENLFGYSGGSRTAMAAGTGIIIRDDGIIVTNRHVVPEGSDSVSVTLSDGTELKDVSVIGRTKSSDTLDIAFLKITDTKGKKLTAAQLGDSSAVQVGDDVVAIGNALGQFQNTVTSGIISGFGRSVQASGGGEGDSSAASDTENLDNLFQTDAAINEGNSGGPLVNLNGQVIGINTAVAGNAQNIGFSIPLNDIRGLINSVFKTGKVTRPFLGVRYVVITADVAKQYKLDVAKGAFIVPALNANDLSVLPDSPADKAGLKERDVITKVANQAIDQTHSLTSLLGLHQSGDKISLTIVRDGKTINIDVTLGESPSN